MVRVSALVFHKDLFFFTLGTAALKIKFVIGVFVEFVACKWINKILSWRSNWNIMRKPFLSMAVIGGIDEFTPEIKKYFEW